MSYWGWGYFPRYVSVEERKRKAAKQLAAMTKKGVVLAPVVINGRTIARSWWGAHWNRNLERYADFSNRLGRGRSYVRSGAVLDLKIEKGAIMALVAGSGRKPYEVKIRIKPLDAEKWKELVGKAAGEIETLAALLEGVFPRELADLFFGENGGLFPKPKEIHFDCSCPDYASMCKHVGAALYGAGARLDAKPDLFFVLRGVDMHDLVGKAATHATGRLLSKSAVAAGKKGRILDLSAAGGVSKMFGIAMDVKNREAEDRTDLKQSRVRASKYSRRLKKHQKNPTRNRSFKRTNKRIFRRRDFQVKGS
jgi:uncharacterized Zn finger protein